MRRTLCLLIGLIMVLSLFPIQLFAADANANGTESLTDWYVDNYKFVIRNGSGVNYLRIAPGEWATSNEIRNAPGLISVDKKLCDSYKDAEGVLTYDFIKAGVYSVWVRYDGGSSEVITPVKITDITPTIGKVNGLTVTVDNLLVDASVGVRDFFLAKGELESYEDVRNSDNLIVRVTAANIQSANNNYCRSYKYEISYKNASKDGWYTVYVRFNDSTRKPVVLHYHVEYPKPEVIVHGIQSKVTALDGVKCVRVAPGEWADASAVKKAPGVRVFTAKTILKNKSEYTVQYRTDGKYTLSIEYDGGYTVVKTITIEHLRPSVTVNDDNTVTLGDLDDLYIIRFAPNPKKSTDWSQGYFKRADGNRYAKAADVDQYGSYTTPVLPEIEYNKNGLTQTSDIWSFMVQYNEESYEIFTVDFNEKPADDNYIVKDGRSAYKILVPENASEQILRAANEFRYFFKEITGVSLNIVDKASSAQGKYFSIGDTSIFRSSGLTASYDELGMDGYKVATYGKAVIMIGENDVSSTYAVYGYLANRFGLEIYGEDCYKFNAAATAEITTVNFTDLPDIPMRNGGTASYSWFGDPTYMNRMRVRNMTDYMWPVGHSFFTILPPSQYLADHPDWYDNATKPNEICKTNEGMKAQFVANLEQMILDHPDMRYVMIGHEDGEPRCNCSNCKAVRRQYSSSTSLSSGADTALEILFMNDVVRRINAWAAQTIPDRELNFIMFAYTTTEFPATRYNSRTGQYYPINNDSKLYLESNLGIMFAPIGAQVTDSYMSQTTYGQNWGDEIRGWQALTNNFYIWEYCCPFGSASTPFDGFGTYAQNIRDWKSLGVKYIFNEGYLDYEHNFMQLRDYLFSKLAWDSSLDTDALVRDFMANYYGSGWNNVYQFYTQWRAKLTDLKNRKDMYSFCAGQLVQNWLRTDLFSKSELDSYDAMFEAALTANEAIRTTDPEKYEMYRDNIRADRSLIRYLLMNIYSSNYDYNTYKAMIDEYAEISEIKGMSLSKLDSLLNQWRQILKSKSGDYVESVITNESFTGDDFTFSNYSGTIDGVSFDGVRATSSAYQPSFYFTANGVKKIVDYANANGYNTLTIHAYSKLFDNILMIGSAGAGNEQWATIKIKISDLSSSMRFWSQSQGDTVVYLWFEFDSDMIVYNQSFVGEIGSGYGFTNYSGTIGGVTFTGVKAASAVYQPSFYFSEYGLNRLRTYAEQNGYNKIIVHTYSILRDNGFMVGSNWTGLNSWYTVELPISEITSSFKFWSQSQGTTEIYMWFEFESDLPVYAQSFVSGADAGFAFTGYSGEIDGVSFTGVKASSSVYQPSFYFSEYGINRLRSYAARDGYDTLRIHAYPVLRDNGLQMGSGYAGNNQWTTIDFLVSELDTDFRFWSQSQGLTDVYMWFELVCEPLVSAKSFSGYGYKFSNVSDTIDGVEFEGVKAISSVYQPTFNFSEYGLNKIKAYAAENGYDMLTVHFYADLYNNGFVANGSYIGNREWKTVDLLIDDITTSTSFWSQSEGTTTIYMWFEFTTEPTISSRTFTGTGFAFSSFSGTVDGVEFDGIKAVSGTYQPSFYFTEHGIGKIREYAAANGFDTVLIHSYAKLYNNSLVIGGNYVGNMKWSVTELSISEISTSTRFWSQSEGATEIYLWFEFKKEPTVPAKAFTGGGFAFESFDGTFEGETFAGVYGKSAAYQPTFSFSEYGVNKIKRYMNENDFDVLIVHSYAKLYNNGFVVNGQYNSANKWTVTEISILDISTSTSFWSQSEGISEVYMWFEFKKEPTVPAKAFTGGGFAFEDFDGTFEGSTFVGVYGKSVAYQPTFSFSEYGVNKIKGYMNENDFDVLIVHSYAKLYNNGFVVNGQYNSANKWTVTEISILDITTSTSFWSQSEGTSEVYMWFEFKKEPTVPAKAFTGGGFTFEDFDGTFEGETFAGVYGKSVAYQPTFSFSEYGVNKINAYAAANGYGTLTVHSYAKLYNNGFVVNGTYTGASRWNSTDIAISDISASTPFWSQSEGASEVYLWFEFK